MRIILNLLINLSFLVWSASPLLASTMFPLEPPATSSPRDTLNSFLHYTEKLYEASRDENDIAQEEALERAIRCFDLSEVAPTLRSDAGIESVLRLREILDRIELPPEQDIPGMDAVKEHEVVLWRIPHTEIFIGRKPDGPRTGSFLFTAETVDKLDEFYEEIRDFPYKEGVQEGLYEQYIYSSGWMFPDGFMDYLPSWMLKGYLGQAVWQWLGMGSLILFWGFVVYLVWRWHRTLPRKSAGNAVRGRRLVFPVVAMVVCIFLEYALDEQINLTGRVLVAVTMGLEFFFFIFAGWAILIAGNVTTYAIISSSSIKEEALDADVIKLVCRLVSFTLVFVLFYHAGSYFGLSVTAIFASAGIAGVAVALAARETLANFFGGVSIFLDRPFRAGDYIVLDSGERGEIKAVGMRSTRLQTRDDIMITIPNSVITNVKITNQSSPEPSFRVRIAVGVAYGSDLDTVEELLMEAAKSNPLVLGSPEARVRLRRFGESSIDYELLCWAARPHDRGRLVHQTSREIYRRFNEEGIEIPFPQRDIRIRRREGSDGSDGNSG